MSPRQSYSLRSVARAKDHSPHACVEQNSTEAGSCQCLSKAQIAVKGVLWRDAAQAGYSWEMTKFFSVPMFSILTSTTSSGFIRPTPDGVPVAMTSPGSSVITPEIKLISLDIPKIRSLVEADWRSSPLRYVSSFRLSGLTSVSIHGPLGAQVS